MILRFGYLLCRYTLNRAGNVKIKKTAKIITIINLTIVSRGLLLGLTLTLGLFSLGIPLHFGQTPSSG
jgi:hypothetical protein